MSNTVVIVGGMASGKTTLAKRLEYKGYKRIVTYTTRPIREGEVDGVDYHFVSDKYFMNLMESGYFAEVTSYGAKFGKCYYGSAKKDYEGAEKKVIVLNPKGVVNLEIDALVVYLDLEDNVLISRAMKRGDYRLEISRRIADDKPYFKEMLSTITPDIVIQNEMDVEELSLVVDMMVKGRNEYGSEKYNQ